MKQFVVVIGMVTLLLSAPCHAFSGRGSLENLTDTERPVATQDGMSVLLGPQAMLDAKGQVVRGYLVRNGVKVTMKGEMENTTNQEVRLPVQGHVVLLGPYARLSNKQRVLRGWVSIDGKRYTK